MKEIDLSKIWVDAGKSAKKKLKRCFYPDCKETAINSHILQKNGILDQISKDGHVWEKKINQFSERTFYFDKCGLKDAFSFKCFCEKHDNTIFKKIEREKVDFNDYQSCLLFTIRTLYNEIHRKLIVIEQLKALMKSKYSAELNLELLLGFLNQQSLGIEDLRSNESDIWQDYFQKTQNFVFKFRKIKKIDICLSGFYNYETTQQMHDYKIVNNKDMERVSAIFINFFPYEDASILLMGYNKKDEKKVKPYFNTFFKESESRVQTKLTNLLMFNCENWVISEQLYKSKIQNVEDIFISAIEYAVYNNNEREFFKVNIFNDTYYKDMIKLKKRIS